MGRYVILSALVLTCTGGCLAATPEYIYSTGDNLNLALEAQSFTGLSDLVTIGVAGSPLDFKTVKPLEPSAGSKYYRMSSVQTSEDYESAFSVSAEAQGSFGAFSASASSKYMQSKTMTSKSSLYFMNFEKQVGTVFINADAKLSREALSLLKKHPDRFAAIYGRYYVHGLVLGCQATATVTITSKTEFDKKSLDVKAKASYSSMISASAEFTSSMKDQKGFDSLETEIFTYGGDVPAAISDLGLVQKEIVDAMDTGGKCTKDNAKVTRAVVKSWLTFPPISDAAATRPAIIKALTPKSIILPEVLSRLNNVQMKTHTLVALADKCHEKVFSCVTKQWDEPTDTRRSLYQGAYTELVNFRNTLDRTNESQLSNQSLVLSYETELEATYQKYLKPAESLTPFTFNFNVRVLNSYDDYVDPPSDGTNNAKASFTIDPNHEDTESAPIKWTQNIQLDNGHSNCHHFYGNFYAKYEAETLYVWQFWNRVCGSQKTLDPFTFHPGGDTVGSTDYDTTVRTKYNFTITYGKTLGTREASRTSIIV